MCTSSMPETTVSSRYPTPFSQTGDLLCVDLIIGQKDNQAAIKSNEGLAAPSRNDPRAGPGGRPYGPVSPSTRRAISGCPIPAIIACSGIPPARSGRAHANDPAADRVLGHSDFTTVSLPATFGSNPEELSAATLRTGIRPEGTIVRRRRCQPRDGLRSPLCQRAARLARHGRSAAHTSATYPAPD